MHHFNAMNSPADDLQNNERRTVCRATEFQACIRSLHWYPYMTVIEKLGAPIVELISRKHGSQWEPFLR